MFLSDEGHTLETLDFTFCIGSTSHSLYFHLYLNTVYRSTLYAFLFYMLKIVLFTQLDDECLVRKLDFSLYLTILINF